MTYDKINDYELVYMIGENSDEVYEIAFKKYKPLLDKTIYQYLNYATRFGLDYDDLYQEGLIAIHYALSHYDERENTLLYTFIKLCIKGKIINLLRVSSAKKYGILNDAYSLSYTCMEGLPLEDTVGTSTDSLDVLLTIEVEKELTSFQYSLTQEYACVLELKRNGFTVSEIATLLDISAKTVSNHLYQIKQKLLKYLKARKII